MAKNMAYGKKSYGKKSCLNTILKWEKSYHFSLTSNFELAVIFSPRCILWQIINITKGTKNINAKNFFDPPACRVGGQSTAVPSYVESRKYLYQNVGRRPSLEKL